MCFVTSPGLKKKFKNNSQRWNHTNRPLLTNEVGKTEIPRTTSRTYTGDEAKHQNIDQNSSYKNTNNHDNTNNSINTDSN